MRHLALFLICALLAGPSAAQAPTQRIRLTGLTLDHWRGAAGPALLRPTLRFTICSPRGPGAEFAVVAFPDGISLSPPAVALGLQAGLVQPIPVGPVTLLPRAGAAAITMTGLLGDSKLFHIIPGAQAGLGLLIPVDRKSTLRLDVTRHMYNREGYWGGVWSFGFGFSGGFRRTR